MVRLDIAGNRKTRSPARVPDAMVSSRLFGEALALGGRGLVMGHGWQGDQGNGKTTRKKI
jgi:hypothetical protein